jgi:hypothetical protein
MRITDTLKAAKTLQSAGFTPLQPESLAVQQETAAQDLVANIGKMLEPKFAELRAEIHAVARDQLFKLMTFGVALAGLCLGFGAFILAFLRTAS